MRKKRPEVPTISDAEWIIMRVIWSRGRLTANQMVEALEGQQEWKPKTIHTLMRRLSDKWGLGVEKVGREYAFYAQFEEADAEEAQSHIFIERVFEGKAIPFLVRFMESSDLTESEIAELRRILRKKSK